MQRPTRVRHIINMCDRFDCDSSKLVPRNPPKDRIHSPADPGLRFIAYGPYTRASCMYMMLPTYAVESFVAILRLWMDIRPSKPQMASLYELCYQVIRKHVNPSSVIPLIAIRPRNHVIHRSLRRLMDRYREACMYEEYAGFPFRIYPNMNPLNTAPAEMDRWFNRTQYLKKQTCSIERINDYLKYKPTPEEYRIYLERLGKFYQDAEAVERYAIVAHQCGYLHCTCQSDIVGGIVLQAKRVGATLAAFKKWAF